MQCSQCGSDAATGAGTCPGCGAVIPTAAEAATLTQAGPAMAFRFDAARWTTADRIAGGATLVLFISLFLPWFSVSAGFGSFSESSSVDALTAHGYLYLVLLLALAMLGYLVASASLASRPALPLRPTGRRAGPRPVWPHRVVPAIPPGRTGGIRHY